MQKDTIKDKEWIILKIFQKYCNNHSSLYQREFLIDSLEIIKFIDYLSEEKSVKVPKSVIWYWKDKIQSSYGLSKDKKDFFIKQLSKINNPEVSLKCLDFLEIKEAFNEIKSLDGEDSYYKKLETRMKEAYVGFGNGTISVFDLELLIKEYISSRLSLQYSLNRVSNLLKGLKSSLEKEENFESKLKEMLDLLASKNLKKKESYKIFVPINLVVQDSKEIKKLKNEFELDGFKIMRYSDVENEIFKINHNVVKDFNKDCFYLSFLDVDGVDIEYEANKVVFEKSAFYCSLLESFNIVANVIFDSPVITYKKTSLDHKINGLIIKNTSFIEIEHNVSSFQAIEALKIFKTGKFGDKTKNKKGFLIAKTDFISSKNPLEKVYLAARLTELYLKSDFKKSYGSFTQFGAFEEKVANKVWKSLLKSHSNYLKLSNYGAVMHHLKSVDPNSKEQKSNYEKLKYIDEWLSEKPKKRGVNLWIRHLLEEIDHLEKMTNGQKSRFIGYINFVFLYVHFRRNAFVHSSVVFNLRDAFLAETLEALLSLAFSKELNSIKFQQKGL